MIVNLKKRILSFDKNAKGFFPWRFYLLKKIFLFLDFLVF